MDRTHSDGEHTIFKRMVITLSVRLLTKIAIIKL